MLTSRPFSAVLFVSGIVAAGFACSSGGTGTEEMIKVPNPPATTGGSTATTAGSGGTGAVVPNAGTNAVGGTGVNQAGSPASGGTGGGPSGGTGSGGTGGMAGGSGGMAGMGEDPNKIVLYDGSEETFNSWKSVRSGGNNPWKNNPDKTMTVETNTGDIQTKQAFQDVFIHLEYMTPKITSAGGGQERGNSGVYLKGSWELQVLDTFGLAPADDGCGAIYEVAAPLVSACKKEEEWNVYEIEFKAQVCENGQQTAPAKFVEVKLNGTIVQQNVSCPANETRAGQPPSCEPKGLLLQDHSSILPVSFRNIWLIPRN